MRVKMNFEQSEFPENQNIVCSICGLRIKASNYYKNKENIICEECYIESRIDRGRKTHWQYIKSVKNDYLVPGKAENNILQ